MSRRAATERLYCCSMQTSTDATLDDFMRGLSDPQREAALHTDGPLLILAGPGSGKTRVVTHRAAYLARTVTEARHILAITFTNKAAKEMQERMAALNIRGSMTVCTFHALGAKLLRIHHERTRVPHNFTIFDRDDRRKLLKKAIAACGLSADNWHPAKVDARIGQAKNDMLTAKAFASRQLDWSDSTIARIYACYEEMLGKMAGLDFDDLLMRLALALKQDSGLRDELEDRYRYVLIDEYQDTNAAQYTIARLLTQQRQNISATGDPDQSIYGWRGADIRNILSFEQDYPTAKVVRLEQNYRSTKRILAAADRLIAGNMERKQKTLWTDNDEGRPVSVIQCDQGDDEASMIARAVAKQVNNGTGADEIAVFYRVNSLSRGIEEAFIREGIRYQVARGVEFYNRKEIKDVLAYLRVLINPADEVSLLRIINTPPRGIGSTTIKRLVELGHPRAGGVCGVLMGDDDLSHLGRSAAKVQQFRMLLRELMGVVDQPASQVLEYVISHSGLRAFYKSAEDAEDSQTENLDELVNAATEYQQEYPEATIIDWLEHTALVSDVDSVADDGGLVTLMTLHAAKGLEFSVVYIMGLEDGLLPFCRRGEDDMDEEEERRLCFVGITRAKQQLTLSHVRYRMLRGVTERAVRSRFLDELPHDQIEWTDVAEKAPRRQSAVPRGQLPDDIAEWQVGTLVRHPLRGLGQVASFHRGARRTHIDVEFKDGTRQSWVLEFAQLERVDYDDIG